MASSGRNELATNIDEDLHYSNRVLAQAEGTGVDFYTINFARLACADVNISNEGQRIFNGCLVNMPNWECVEERLQFGYGNRHLFRNMGVQLYEYEHLLLSAALDEFFSEDYVAAVYSELAGRYEDEQRAKPPLSAFRGFARATNGLLATTRFPLMVDDRIRLNPYKDHDNGMPHIRETNEAIPIDKVASALCMLGKLRIGKVKELTFAGGDVLGWFSAYIQMFLGLSVSLIDLHGDELHRSNGGDVAVKLMFVPPEASPGDYPSDTIWLRGQLNPALESSKIPPKLTGRIVPESVFSNVFGKAFHILDHSETKAFGNALGCGARMFELAARNRDMPSLLTSEEARSDTGSWGPGLIQTWTNWFPELRHLQGRMERGLKKDWDEAGKICMETIHRLEALCGCFICSQPRGPDDNPTNLPENNFCIPAMMETVFVLGLTLSRITLIPELYPSRAGFLMLYKAQAQKRLDIRSRNATGTERDSIMFGDDWNSSKAKRLQYIVTMLSGSRPTADIPDNLVAISHEGICAYVLKLQRGDKAKAREDDGVIRVTTGHITWRYNTYNRLCVGPPQPAVGVEDGWESFKSDLFSEKIYVK